MMTVQAGHNSAAFGEELRDDIETVLGDDHKTVFRYAQWHINDYIEGTEGLSLEYEGAYIRFLMRLYRRGKPLPDDDRFMATMMDLSVRVWRRIKQTLIQFGKIVCRNGCLTNARFENERQKRAAQIRKQSEAAQNRWARERAEKEVSSKFAESLDETSTKLSQNMAEKSNKINDPPITTHMLTNNHYPIKKKESPNGLFGSNEPAPGAGKRECEIDQAYEAYRELAQRLSLPVPRKPDSAKRKMIRARINDAGGLEGWMEILRKIENSPFLRGERTDFQISFPWMLKKSHFDNILDGSYDNNRRRTKANGKYNGFYDGVE